MAMAAADPAPAEVITWARGSATFPAAQTPGTLVSPVPSTSGKPASLRSQPSGQQAVVMGKVAGPDEHRGACDHPAVGELDTGQPVVLDHQPCHLPGHDPDPPGLQLALFGWHQGIGVDEEDDIVGPLPDQEGVLRRAGQGAQHPERLVAHFPAVAVRAVQQVLTPPLAEPGNVG